MSNTFLQPFLAYTTKDAWTFTVNSESSYDWRDEDWSVPLNFVISKLLKIEGHPISIGVGPRYWEESPQSGRHGWGGPISRHVFISEVKGALGFTRESRLGGLS